MNSFAEQMGSFVGNLVSSAADRSAYLADLKQECEEAQANREHLMKATHKETEDRAEAVQELLADFASGREELRADLAAGAALWAGHGGRKHAARTEAEKEGEPSRRKKHKAKGR